jgi:hypothetical protein
MTNSTIARPYLAMALFPAMLANPFYVLYASLSGAAYVVNKITSFNSLFLLKSEATPSLVRATEPAKAIEPKKSGERSTLKLAVPAASNDAG